MRRTIRSRPSPSIVVAALALTAAVAGTAVAAPTADTSALTKSKVKRIANKQINKAAPGLSVATARQLAQVTVQEESLLVEPNSTNAATVPCPAGQQALSGGYGTPVGSIAQASQPVIAASPNTALADNQTFDAWHLTVRNNNPAQITSRVWVVCAG